jgi:hypothetical protein
MITREKLKEFLEYDRCSGLFKWIISKGSAGKGRIAGKAHDFGYVLIRIDQKGYYAHRLAWLYEYGSFPQGHVDHINGNPNDNRLENLRIASNTENMQNIKGVNKNNSSGFLGVSFHKRSGKYRADIRVKSKKKWLGFFETAELAFAAYMAAKRQYHPFSNL